MEFQTADLCDQHEGKVRVVAPMLRSYGGRRAFHGAVATLKLFEDNSLVRKALESPGNGRVLVVDGGGSLRSALVGDQLAQLGVKNGWAGIVVWGCIRDSNGLVRWRLEDVNGKVSDSGEQRVTAKPLADTPIQAFDFADKVSDKNKRDLVFVAELYQGKEKLATSVSTFAPIKHLALKNPGLTVDVALNGDTLTFNVSAQSLVPLRRTRPRWRGCGLQRQLLRCPRRAIGEGHRLPACRLDIGTVKEGSASTVTGGLILENSRISINELTKRAEEGKAMKKGGGDLPDKAGT